MRRYFDLIDKKLIRILLIIFVIVSFIDLANIDRHLHKGACSLLDLLFDADCPDFYDIPFWSLLEVFGTISGVFVTGFAAVNAIRQSNKQLSIEQEPYVVADGSISLVETEINRVTLKNVGRGSALRITCSTDEKDRDKAFFENTESHSYYLPSNNQVKSLASVDSISQIKTNKKDEACYFYIFYEDQMGKSYKTEVKMKLPDEEGKKFVVMENNRYFVNNK